MRSDGSARAEPRTRTRRRGTDGFLSGFYGAAMGIDISGYRGRSTFITGPEKGCGKTSFLNAVLGALRGEGECPGILGIGFDGEARDALTGGSRPRIPAFAGETVLTAERFLRSSQARFEILETLPGTGALGRLVLARVLRAGDVLLVGPERNEYAALAMRLMREEFGVDTILADGAMNRITQVSAFEGARFVYVLRADRSNLDRQVAAMKRLHFLAHLPRADFTEAGEEGGPEADRPGAEAAGLPKGAIPASTLGLASTPVLIRGALTPRVAAELGADGAPVVVEDFTKVFLEWRELATFARRHSLSVFRGMDFAGFTVILRNLGRAEFLSALGDPGLAGLVTFNPLEVGTEVRCA